MAKTEIRTKTSALKRTKTGIQRTKTATGLKRTATSIGGKHAATLAVLAEPVRVFPLLVMSLATLLSGAVVTTMQFFPVPTDPLFEKIGDVYDGAALFALILGGLCLLVALKRIIKGKMLAKLAGLLCLLISIAGGGLGVLVYFEIEISSFIR